MEEFVIRVREIVADCFGVTVEDLDRKSRKREYTEPRMLAMYFIWKYYDISLRRIGFLFGGRDHSTVIHAKDTVIDLLETNRFFRGRAMQANATISSLLIEPETQDIAS